MFGRLQYGLHQHGQRGGHSDATQAAGWVSPSRVAPGAVWFFDRAVGDGAVLQPSGDLTLSGAITEDRDAVALRFALYRHRNRIAQNGGLGSLASTTVAVLINRPDHTAALPQKSTMGRKRPPTSPRHNQTPQSQFRAIYGIDMALKLRNGHSV